MSTAEGTFRPEAEEPADMGDPPQQAQPQVLADGPNTLPPPPVETTTPARDDEQPAARRHRRSVSVIRREPVANPRPTSAIGLFQSLRFGDPRSSYGDVFGLPPLHNTWPLPSGDALLESAELGWASLRAASVRGEAKRHTGECRQDALLIRRSSEDNQCLLVAVADGVGNADLSHIGSQLACSAAITAAGTSVSPTDEDPIGPLRAARKAILDWSEAQDVDFRRLATTLAIAVIRATRSGAEGWVAAVGDSGASIARGEGLQHIQAEPESALTGPIHSTTTAALPGELERARALRLDLHADSTLLLWTDGFKPLLDLESSKSHYERLFRDWPPPLPAEFLWHVDARVRSYDDDRTVAAIWVRDTND